MTSHVRSHQVVLGVFLLAVTLTLAVPVSWLSARGNTWRGVWEMSDETRRDAGGSTSGYEAVGTCKATCVQKMLNWPPSDKQCLDNDQCVMCWQLCELLHHAEPKWRATCVEPDCSVGCMLACDFDFANAKSGWSDSTWEFPSVPVTTELGEQALSVSWSIPRRAQSPPTGSKDVVMPVFFVYTLLFQVRGKPSWSKATSTVNREVEVTGVHASLPDLRFMLLASSTRGTVCVGHPPYPAVGVTTTTTTTVSSRPPLPAQPVLPRWNPSIFTDNAATHSHRKTGADLFPSKEDESGRLWGVSVYVETTPEGRLHAMLTWRHELWRPLPLYYVITWERHSCNVNPAAPHCPLPAEQVTAELAAKKGEEMRLVLSELTYNSQYQLDVGLSDAAPEQVYFYTPVCTHPSSDFTQCEQKVQTEPTNMSPVTTDSTSTTTTATAQMKSVGWRNIKPVEVQVTAPTFLSSQDQLIVLNAAVSVATLVVVMVGWCVYRKLRRRPDPNREMLKAMQSYASLPLLNASLSHAGSFSNLVHHGVNQQSLLYGSPPDHARSVLGSTHSVDTLLDDSSHQWASTPMVTPHPSLTALHPLGKTHLSVSSILQVPPSGPLDHAPTDHAPTDHAASDHTPTDHTPTDHTPLDTAMRRAGARTMNVTENPLRELGELVLPQIHAVKKPGVAVLSDSGNREARRHSMDNLNHVSASLGQPCAVRKASSTTDLVLHG